MRAIARSAARTAEVCASHSGAGICQPCSRRVPARGTRSPKSKVPAYQYPVTPRQAETHGSQQSQVDGLGSKRRNVTIRRYAHRHGQGRLCLCREKLRSKRDVCTCNQQ